MPPSFPPSLSPSRKLIASPVLSAPDLGLISLGHYPCLRQGLEKLRSPSPVALKTPFLTPSAETLPLGPQAPRAPASSWNIFSLLMLKYSCPQTGLPLVPSWVGLLPHLTGHPLPHLPSEKLTHFESLCKNSPFSLYSSPPGFARQAT